MKGSNMEENRCCAILGQHPLRFSWGFDEEDNGCQKIKLELAQKIMELRQEGVTRFAVVADCGVGLYAGEIINALREEDRDLMLFVVTPYEEQAKKWAPYLRERYFDMLIACTHMEAISLHETLGSQYEAYKRVIDYADTVVSVYDPALAGNDAIGRVMRYATEKERDIIYIRPDTLKVSRDDKTLCIGGSKMIELLFPEEFPFGEPEYSKLSEEIRQLHCSIAHKLNDEGNTELERLSDTYLRQSNVAVRSAFC